MRLPIDLVTDKHELITFDSDQPDGWQQLEIEHDGSAYRVRVPIAYDNGVERIVRVDDCGSLLYLLGEVGHDHADQGRIGCLIVARPLEDGTYRTVVFHSLYPRTVKGLAE
jgi:hypothetical protein